ncbi:ABC transporter ATP-binding protein [Metamycoplasma hominis]|uniref:Lmp related protein n=1 Tax=Metamycoplasma hominis (strain ATCC 23114 / DSM 25592 / NBRC 14850 / NCTC 10111 / PG21) TaxID=347256 RepID=D1J8G1_METH1|nr:Lmp related protein [Metamycoplasma hominis]AYK04758.1 ABC transporter ATP-binding protein [Metamycoplasma hominis]OKL23202.1 ABC transporter ATP-binding protein [Metamycoplasma hominis]CAX37508.1 Lmp related protein [Metamycoplasma hominis ATCC 23114]
MKKKNLSLQILALCVAAGSMPVLASKCTVTVKVKEKFNALKSQLQNLISKLSDEEQQELNEWLVNQEREFKGDNSQGDNEIIKNIEEKINVLTKKINEQKKQNSPSKDENKELNIAIEQLKKSKQELQNLIDFSADQGIENSKAKEILDSTNIEENSSISEVKEKTNKINKAKQDLQNLIEDTKNKAKNEFDIKKQELKTLIESEKARNIDKSEEQNVLNTTNVAESSNISDIKSKTKIIEEAINSLTKKINEQKNKQEFEQAKQDFEKIKKELQELIATPDAKEVENIDDINKTLNEANIAQDWTISKIQDVSNNLKNTKEQLENKINTTKHQVKQNFEAKKQELKTLIDSAKTKNVDNSEAQNVFDTTNVVESLNISDIKSKTKKIEEAIKSLTQKINEAKSHEVVPPSDEFLKIEKEFQDQKKQIESKLDEICSLNFNKTYSGQLTESNESIKKGIKKRVDEVYGDYPGYETKYYYRRAYNARNKEDCKKYINQLKNIYKIVDMYANYLKEIFRYIESEEAKLSDEIKQKIMNEDVLNPTELSRSKIEFLNWDFYVKDEENVKFITEKKKVFDNSLAKVKKAIFDKMIDDMFNETGQASVYKIETFLPSETVRDEKQLYFDKSLPLFKLFSEVSVNFNTFLGQAKTKGIYKQDGKLRFEGFIEFHDPKIPYYKYIGLEKPITIDEITIKAQ